MSSLSSDPRPYGFRRRHAVVILVLILVVAGGLIWVVHHHSTPQVGPPPVGGRYSVVGNKIIGPTGKQFIPEGIVVFGLSEPNWQSHLVSDKAQIAAIAEFWHANTVRLQVAPNNLLTGPNTALFLTYLKEEVSYALSLGLDVWISAQDEHTGAVPMPTQATVQFWQKVAPIYAAKPRVWFDLFNEPRLKAGKGHAGSAALSSDIWSIWQNGNKQYVGMQTLVNTVRATGATNIILAEGIDFARTLSQLPSHLLHGRNIVYDVHAYFVKPRFSSPSDWGGNWGNLSGRYAIVVGEWSEFEGQKGACVSDPRTLIPEFLNYLTSHHIGLIAWWLGPGVLTQGSNLRDPTTLSSTEPYVCGQGVVRPNEQGAGALVLSYFAQQSHPPPAVAS
jgi:endoglucanase